MGLLEIRMLHISTAPQNIDPMLPRPWIFMAGGITNCPLWQDDLIDLLIPDVTATLFNPRRKHFPIKDLSESKRQIRWEKFAMNNADIVSFWFSCGSDNPIVMFEYGFHVCRFLETGLPKILVGCDPSYSRVNDIVIQTELFSKHIPIYFNLSDLAACIRESVASMLLKR